MKNLSYTPSFAWKLTFFAFFALANTVQMAAQSCTLTCNDFIQIEVPDNGTKEFLPTDMAEGNLSQSCPNGIFQTQVLINNVWQNASGNFVFNATHVGETFLGRVRDQNTGNSCWGQVYVVPELPDTIRFQLCSESWKNARPLKGTTLIFQPTNPAFPYFPIVFALDSNQHCAQVTVVPSDYLPGTTFIYGASLPNIDHLNGVDMVDLCLVSKHVLGIAPLSSPYAMIAADVNKSGGITTFDMVESRKLILGIYDEFPNNTAWRFISDYCEFQNPNNPFEGCDSEIDIIELSSYNGDTATVFGVKTGDVNGDAQLNGGPYIPPTVTDSVALILPEGPISAGASIAVPVKLDKDFTFGGLQTQFLIDPTLAIFESISDGVLDVSAFSANYMPTGHLNFSHLSAQSIFAPAGVPLFYIHIKTLQAADLKDILTVVTDNPGVRTYAIGYDCYSYYSVGGAYAGKVPVYSPELRGLKVQPPSPNPFGEQSFLEIELEGTETVVLELMNLTGQVIFSEERNLAPGVFRWEMPASLISPSSLTIWRLRVGEQMAVGKLVRE